MTIQIPTRKSLRIMHIPKETEEWIQAGQLSCQSDISWVIWEEETSIGKVLLD